MKNASKHADNLKALTKRLAKEGPVEPLQLMEPLDAFVRAAMSYDVADSRADDALKIIASDFVDLNEFRVATDLEIHDLLGIKYPAIEDRVAMITLSLNFIFEREHTLSLDRLRTVSKRDARQFIRELPTIHPFVEAYVMLMALDGPAMPMDDEILNLLREHEVVEESATLLDAQKFIENHVKGEDIYELFVMLRRTIFKDAKKKVKT
jgi:hypothetical protein